MTLPKLTTKQQEITRLLFRYRFLDRIHIQALLNHKDKRRVISWLKDLREKQYVEWIYDGDNFAEKTKPAIYYLGLKGIRFLRSTNEYPPEQLRKRYKEATRQKPFIDRCLMLADCCVHLRTRNSGNVSYSYWLEADNLDSTEASQDIAELQPHLYFVKREGNIAKSYTLEVFDTTTPRYMIKKRLKDYAECLDAIDEPPVALFICPATAELIYAKRRARKMLEDNELLSLRFTTVSKVKTLGLTAMIWEEA